MGSALLIVGIVLVAAWATKGKIPPLTGEPSADPETPFSPTTYPWEIQQFARAIARAEGFYSQGSAPQRAHNPGAIKPIGWTGPITGTQGIAVFPSDEAGFEALHRQLWLIATGRSSVYTSTMTIDAMAKKWTTTQQSGWATNVATALGVSTSTRLSQVLA